MCLLKKAHARDFVSIIAIVLRAAVFSLLIDLPAHGIVACSDKTKAILIFSRCEERAYHAAIVVLDSVVQNIEPEPITACVPFTAQVAEGRRTAFHFRRQ